ncbi:MAG: hemolysin family protein [Chloroflexaceae bacterium]
MLVEIGVILMLVLANGVFAGTEAALIAARRGRLEQRAERDSGGAALAITFQEDPNRFLSTVQVGITLIGVLAGAFGGANLAAPLQTLLEPLPLVGSYAGTIAFALVVVSITYLSLVLGELVPKRLALQSAEAIAVGMAQPMHFLAQINRPIVTLLTWSTEGILALLGRRNMPPEVVTEEDIRHLVRQGTMGGSVEPQEQQLIERIFKFSDRAVHHIQTPRVDVHAFETQTRLGDILGEVIESGYSRFPVYEEDLDHVIGMVHVRDMLRLYWSEGEDGLIRSIMYPPLFVPESSRAAALLATFRKEHRHFAVVVGEHGGVEGVATMEDVLEEIVGEIADETDEAEEPAVVQREDGSWLIDGSLPIDRLKQHLELEALPGEEMFRFDTLAGFILSLAGQIPQVGDSIHWEQWRFEIVDMDGLRIDKVLVSHEAEANTDVDSVVA